ncbi:hypothetical protein HDU87_007569 [Geranomyces variabilis]|uniref:Uncharacterized protein n=1 Tax=Geranomyces variabilis TaxID=109894 RepID=A0AAD5TGF3_9FUNG|nr:hypothetical protein HDU87_007569 [Geranomyces variabilis]
MSTPSDGDAVEDMDAERFANFRQHLHRVRQALETRFNNNNNDASAEGEEEGTLLTLHEILARVNESALAQDADADEFAVAEVRGALRTMTRENNGVWFQEEGGGAGSVMFI